MARRTTLTKLLDDLRAEMRVSLNPAHNTQARETQIRMLQRVQERLWDDFDWPHLRVERQVPVQIGQRYYETPEDMAIDRIERIDVFRDGVWMRLAAGIEACHYAAHNSDLDERAFPPRCWQIHEDEDVEIWPISDQAADVSTLDGTLRFTGIRNLKPLVEDGDRADLDDRMLVLMAAGELLAASGAKDAQFKLDLANRIYARKRSGLTPAKKTRLFGIGEATLPRRRFAHYRPNEA